MPAPSDAACSSSAASDGVPDPRPILASAHQGSPLDRSPEATFRRLDGHWRGEVKSARRRQSRLDLVTLCLFAFGMAAGVMIGMGLGALATTVGG